MMVCRRGDARGIYEALQVLGQGSFGTVYLGEDVDEPGRRVALKSVSLRNAEGGADGGEEARHGWDAAVEEARLLRRLRHPHVLACHEWFEEDAASGGGRRLWMVLDLLDGGDMNDFYKSRRQALAAPPEAPFIRRLVSSIGGALGYVHDTKVLHRDVKCANLLLSGDRQRIVLCDFGLACSAEDVPMVKGTETGNAVGTPSYLSPEVLCGQPHSAHSDAWALGVCVFRAAALQRPFEGRDDLTLMMRIVKCPPSDLPWSCEAAVACAIMGLLTKDCGKRLLPKEAVALTHEAPIARLSLLARQAAILPPREFADLPGGLSRL